MFSSRCSAAQAYQALLRIELDVEDVQGIRAVPQRRDALGSKRFRGAIAAMLGRRVNPPRNKGQRRRDEILGKACEIRALEL